ncbi:MAG: GDSL-type esterase/lipase family protein [Patescibacteria group bacterium]
MRKQPVIFSLSEGVAIILVVSSFIFYFISAGTFNYYHKPPTQKVIVAFGDSLTSGFGVQADKNFVSRLALLINNPVINVGRTGDTTATALLRLDNDVLARKPDIVLVLLGGNDFLHNTPTFSVFKNLEEIIKKIQNSGAKVILIGVSQQFLANYEMNYSRLAWDNKIAGYVPDILGGILLRRDLMHDDIHPNEYGHQIMAERILLVLKKVLELK